jgi:hypothetical protein
MRWEIACRAGKQGQVLRDWNGPLQSHLALRFWADVATIHWRTSIIPNLMLSSTSVINLHVV